MAPLVNRKPADPFCDLPGLPDCVDTQIAPAEVYLRLARYRGGRGERSFCLKGEPDPPGQPNTSGVGQHSWDVAAQLVAQRSRFLGAGIGTLNADAVPLGNVADNPLSRDIADKAQLLLQTVVVRGERTDEGRLIEAVTVPWFEIVALLTKDPKVAFQMSPERWEEMVAGAYHRAGFDEVTLTPRSGDHGRDVIAVKTGLGQVRVIDQVKAFKPPHLVTANDVRALMGVLQTDGASKGFLTTTSDFAPLIRADPLITPFFPARLELVNGARLIERLTDLAKRPDG